MPEFLQYPFMVKALIAGLLASIIAPSIGIFLVVKRYSLIVDTLAHTSLLGVILGIIFSTFSPLNPILFSVFFTTSSGVLIEKVKERSNLYQESILALFLSASLAISLILLNLQPNLNVNILGLLFGSITTVTTSDLLIITILSFLVLGIIYKSFSKMFLIALDENIAAASGIHTKAYNLLYVILTAITVSFAARIIGVLLISALMVIPVITAINFKQSFKKTLLISLGISIFSVLGGLIFSYYANWPSGASIVLVTILFFLASLFPKHKQQPA